MTNNFTPTAIFNNNFEAYQDIPTHLRALKRCVMFRRQKHGNFLSEYMGIPMDFVKFPFYFNRVIGCKKAVGCIAANR